MTNKQLDQLIEEIIELKRYGVASDKENSWASLIDVQDVINLLESKKK